MTVKEVQSMLNSIRITYHHTWPYVKDDGRYGPLTASAVKGYQVWRNISSQPTPNGPVLGDYTIQCIRETYKSAPKLTNAVITPNDRPSITVGRVYYAASTPVKMYYSTYQNINTFADFFSEWEKAVRQQAYNLKRRIGKLPQNTRARHLTKALDKSQEFIQKASKHGVNAAAKITYGSLTKNDIIKYLKDCSEAISGSSAYKFIKNAKDIFVRIKKVLKPIYDFFNKIPGLKYLGAIEKIVEGTIAMMKGEFESASKYYMDGLREIIESVLVDIAVAAAIALGGWIALVLALIVIIAAIIIDYFFFSDNPGESLADKYTGMKTRNLSYDLASWSYDKINGK